MLKEFVLIGLEFCLGSVGVIHAILKEGQTFWVFNLSTTPKGVGCCCAPIDLRMKSSNVVVKMFAHRLNHGQCAIPLHASDDLSTLVDKGPKWSGIAKDVGTAMGHV